MKRFWPLALFVALALFHLGSACVGEDDVYMGDLFAFEAPRDRMVAEAFRKGELPTWAPGICGGAPALGAQELGLLYPPNIVLAVVATERARAIGLLLHYVLMAAGVFALARKLGTSQAAATLAGVTFAFGGALLSEHIVLVYVRSWAWVPWALAGMLRARDREKGGLPLAVGGLLGAYLAGDPFGCLIAAVMGFVLGFGSSDRKQGAHQSEGVVAAPPAAPQRANFKAGAIVSGRMERRDTANFDIDRTRIALVIGLAGVLALLLGAPQLLPAMSAVKDAERSEGYVFEEVTRWSLWPPELGGVAVPFEFGAISRPETVTWSAFSQNRPWCEALYLGPVVLALAAAALSRVRRDRLVIAGLVLIVIFLPFAFGSHTRFYDLVFAFKPTRVFRFPAKFFVPVSLGLSLLAARGLDLVREDDRARKVALAALGVLAAITMVGANVVTLNASEWGEALDALGGTGAGKAALESLAARIAHVAIVALGAIALLVRGRRRSLALVALVVVDLAVALRPAIPLAPRPLLSTPPAVAALIPKEDGPSRILSGSQAKKFTSDERAEAGDVAASCKGYHEGLGPNSGLGQGVVQQDGFLSSPPLRTSLVELVKGDPSRQFVLRGARYALLGAAEVGSFSNVRPIATVRERTLVALDAPSWAAVYRRATFVPELGPALSRISIASFDPRREVVLEARGSSTDGPPPVAAKLVELGFGRIELELPGVEGWLVVRESYAPGWTARVDGEPAEIVAADALFRAVKVSASSKRLVFEYRAPGARLGFLVSAATLVAWIVLSRRK